MRMGMQHAHHDSSYARAAERERRRAQLVRMGMQHVCHASSCACAAERGEACPIVPVLLEINSLHPSTMKE